MIERNLTVFIVDDDQAVRDALADLVDSVGYGAEIYATAQDFLAAYTPEFSGCLVLDIRMPGMSGLELQDELARRGAILPTIFITAHGDVPMAVQAMRQGAQDFIQKPFRDQDLLDRVNRALETAAKERETWRETQIVKQHIHELTPREREVLDKIVAGKPNKVIAIEMDLSQRTVEVHRARLMGKLQTRSLADLVRGVTRAGFA